MKLHPKLVKGVRIDVNTNKKLKIFRVGTSKSFIIFTGFIEEDGLSVLLFNWEF